MENLRYSVFLFTILCCLFAVAVQGASAFFEEERVENVPKTESDLRQDLFRNYDKLVRPVRSPSTVVQGWLSISPLALNEMDEVRGLLVLDSWLMIRWKDEYLQWDPASYSGITTFNLPSSEVWKPDFTLYTGSPDTTYLPTVHTQVVISNTGDVIWVPPFTISSRCPLPPSKIARKTIECNMQIGSWTYSAKQLDIQKFSEEVDLSNFYDTNPDWQLVYMTSNRESKIYACCPDEYPLLNFNVTLKRRWSSYKNALSENSPLTTLL